MNAISAAKYQCCSIHQHTKMAIINRAAESALGTLITLSDATGLDGVDEVGSLVEPSTWGAWAAVDWAGVGSVGADFKETRSYLNIKRTGEPHVRLIVYQLWRLLAMTRRKLSSPSLFQGCLEDFVAGSCDRIEDFASSFVNNWSSHHIAI